MCENCNCQDNPLEDKCPNYEDDDILDPEIFPLAYEFFLKDTIEDEE